MILDSLKKFNSRFSYNNTSNFGLFFSLNVTSICHEGEYTDGSVIKKIDTVVRDFSCIMKIFFSDCHRQSHLLFNALLLMASSPLETKRFL